MSESSGHRTPPQDEHGPAAVHQIPKQIAERFHAAWTSDADPETASHELLPTRLARAAAGILGADGVGLSVIQDQFRVPVGASDDDGVAAERLQFTVGEGPCLAAVRRRAVVRAGGEELEALWPAYYDELVRHTPYRSILAIPFAADTDVTAALDLYFREPDAAADVNIADVTAVTVQISALLRASNEPAEPAARSLGVDLPVWLRGPHARDRLRLWIAAGVLMVRLRVDAPDALALLRTYAYSRDRALDDLGEAVIAGTLPAEALLA